MEKMFFYEDASYLKINSFQPAKNHPSIFEGKRQLLRLLPLSVAPKTAALLRMLLLLQMLPLMRWPK